MHASNQTLHGLQQILDGHEAPMLVQWQVTIPNHHSSSPTNPQVTTSHIQHQIIQPNYNAIKQRAAKILEFNTYLALFCDS